MFNIIFYKNVTGGESQTRIGDRRHIAEGDEDIICDNCYTDINIQTEHF